MAESKMWENEEVVSYMKGDYVYIDHHCGYRTKHTAGRILRVTPKGSVSVVALEEEEIESEHTGTASYDKYKIKFDATTNKPIECGAPIMYKTFKGSAPKNGDSSVEGVASVEKLKTQTFVYNQYY